MQLLISPAASGLFHSIVSMSGSPNISVDLQTAEQAHESDFLAYTKCANVSEQDLLHCLYNLDGDEVYAPTIASTVLAKKSIQ